MGFGPEGLELAQLGLGMGHGVGTGTRYEECLAISGIFR